ncbi:MAG TPA: hypothetical protein VMT85_25565 [Thermoanaerobaculia bacterium]|nr:hypothetical protein [Thermoanaerobaculia bacterium]
MSTELLTNPHRSSAIALPALKLLDVTLRDGGYLNRWSFTLEAMETIVTACADSSVDLVEVGYLGEDASLPPAASCPPSVLERLRKAAGGAGIAVMLRPTAPDPRKILASRSGLLDLVRIPTAIRALEPALTMAEQVREAGCDCSLNLTNLTAYPEAEVLAAAEAAARSGLPTHLYLADSRGASNPTAVASLMAQVRRFWDGPLGFHGHDNRDLGLDNALAAHAAGCTWLDGSINGFGQGGGNVVLQELVAASRSASSPLRRSLDHAGRVLGLERLTDRRSLYRLSASRNVSQDWIDLLAARYPVDHLLQALDTIPSRGYQSLDELFAELGWEPLTG